MQITNEFKLAYRALGQLMADAGTLADADHLYFLRHDEIADCLDDESGQIAALACDRQNVFGRQSSFQFRDVFTGKPEPLSVEADTFIDGQLAGLPVSTGVVEGIARVAHTPAEAAALQPGDILIAPITDIGWAPYFRMIAGLATDIGSSVSHGAVIAREYGLPALVNTGNGTRVIHSGDRIRLDANLGMIEILEKAGD